MAQITIVTCEKCSKTLYHGEEKINSHEGLAMEIGYSRGGWGHRREFIKMSTEELCTDCFEEASVLIKPLADWWNKRK